MEIHGPDLGVRMAFVSIILFLFESASNFSRWFFVVGVFCNSENLYLHELVPKRLLRLCILYLAGNKSADDFA